MSKVNHYQGCDSEVFRDEKDLAEFEKLLKEAKKKEAESAQSKKPEAKKEK
jgi:hypothetical protein